MMVILLMVAIIVGLPEMYAQDLPVLELSAYKRIDKPAREEVSGIIKSRRYENVYWVHGDSGTPDRIYAINRDGEIVAEGKDYKGTKVKGAKNKDWEDIALGEDGTLILSDLGNNCECRDDLKIIILSEPAPDDKSVDVIYEFYIEYPQRTDLIGKFLDIGYNSEGIFQKDGVIYVLSKQPGITRLFKLEDPQEDSVNTLTFVESMKTESLVTAADISKDGSLLAILLYDQIIIADISEGSFFGGRKWSAYLKGTEQIEAVTFDSDSTLIITEENGDLYEIQLSDLKPISD